MIRRILRILFVYSVSLLVLLVLAGCTGGGSPASTPGNSTYTVSGTITDSDNGPIAGAVLSFGSFGSATSNPDGTWTKSGLKGSVIVRVAKDGWSFTPPSIAVSGERNGVSFRGETLDAFVMATEALVDPNPPWPPSSNHNRVTLSLESTGGPGYFKVQFWGKRPNVVNPPMELFGETEVYEVEPGWSDTAAWDVWTPSASSTTSTIREVVVLSRNKGDLTYRETSRITPALIKK